jgi:aryl-alcohol dehydrogenase-like predicted oxidoreductase
MLDAVYDSGCRFIDTADVYADSEELLGKWCALLTTVLSSYAEGKPRFARTGKRSEIFLATKFGFTGKSIDGSPEYMNKQFAQSLERMQSMPRCALRR